MNKINVTSWSNVSILSIFEASQNKNRILSFAKCKSVNSQYAFINYITKN